MSLAKRQCCEKNGVICFVYTIRYSLLLVRKVDQQIEHFGEIRLIYHLTKNLFQLNERQSVSVTTLDLYRCLIFFVFFWRAYNNIGCMSKFKMWLISFWINHLKYGTLGTRIKNCAENSRETAIFGCENSKLHVEPIKMTETTF